MKNSMLLRSFILLCSSMLFGLPELKAQTMTRQDKIFIKTGIQFGAWTNVDQATEDGGQAKRVFNNINRTGRYIRVQTTRTAPLSLAEVQVYSGGVNIALSKTTQQSSNLSSGGLSSLAVDGNTNGQYASGSVTHTIDGNAAIEPWWQVDIGTPAAIDSIIIWNRTDCCTDRLDGFYLFVSNNSFTSNTLAGTLSQAGVSSFEKMGTDYFPSGAELTNIGFDPTYYTWPMFNYTISNVNPNAKWSMAGHRFAYDGRDRGPSTFEQANGFLNSLQTAKADKLLSISFGDEVDYTHPNFISNVGQWMTLSRAKYPDVVCHTNQWGYQWSESQVKTYMQTASPDMLTFDDYPFYYQANQPGPGNSYRRIYEVMQIYRQLALGGKEGKGAAPLAYGGYMQGFKGDRNGGQYNYFPSESEFNLHAFAYLTMGAKWLNIFRYITSPGETAFFYKGPNGLYPQYWQWASIIKQVRNLSPHLSRLRSVDVRVIPGQNSAGTNAIPSDIAAWGPSADPYITSIVATNLVSGTNGGLRGDVLVGYFVPVPGIDNTAGITMAPVTNKGSRYFMLLNGLNKSNGCCAVEGTPQIQQDTIQGKANLARQKITLAINFGSSPVDTLYRVRRSDGAVEMVNLTLVSGKQYTVNDTLDGGLADLFYWKNKRYSPALSIPTPVIVPAAAVTVNYTNSSGNTLDWIGIYKSTDVPGTNVVTTFAYVPGLNGSLSFSNSGGFTTGQYYAAFFSNDSYNEIANRVAFTVDNNAPAISVTPQAVIPGGTVTVNYVRGPGNATDWIGIYKSTDIPGQHTATAFAYVTSSNGNVSLGGFAEGQYYAAFFSNNSYVEVAARVSFTVSSSGALKVSSPEAEATLSDQTLPQVQGDALINVYPNPATENRLYIELQSLVQTPASITVVDMSGKVLLKTNRHLAKGRSKIELDISVLPAGVYILNVENRKMSKAFKFIKQSKGRTK